MNSLNMDKINSLHALKGAFKDDINKGNLYSLPPSMILEEPGFNKRNYETDRVQEHIQDLKFAYMRGDPVPPIYVKVVNGEVFVKDGHLRRIAMNLAIAEGVEIERTPVLTWDGDEISETLMILTSNNGLKLEPLERAAVYHTLKAVHGLTDAEIADRTNKSVTHVKQQLDLINLPAAVKKMVQANEVSATQALDCYSKNGRKAADILKGGLDAAKDKGKTKVTKKDIKPEPDVQDIIELPNQGSNWSDSDGNTFWVLMTTNELSTDQKKQPITVVYENIIGIWSMPLNGFDQSFTEME